MIARLVLAVLIAMMTGSTATAQDNRRIENNWHQWRGPLATGAAVIGDPPTTWSEAENIAWKVPIEGEGTSTPIVWDDRVFVLSAIITDQIPEKLPIADALSRTQPPKTIVQFVVWCLDRNDGKTLWKKVVAETAPHEGRHPSTTYAAASPVTDGKHLYVSFGSYGIFCLTLDGEVVWSQDLGDMRTRLGWGEGVSPVLHENQLVVMWDQEDQSKIFVLNTSDGSVLWQQQRDEPTTWATPVVATRNESTQVITSGTNKVRSYDIKTGNILWSVAGLTLNAIPCPVLVDDHVICMSGYKGNKAVSIDLASAGGSKNPTPDWQLDHDTPYVPSPLVTSGRLYFTKGLAAIVSCVDVKTGKPVFETQRLPGLDNLYASPVATNNNIYFSSREGKTLVIRNNPKFEVVATNQLDGQLDASPAISGDQIFLRTKSHLYCIASTKRQ